MKRHNKKQIGFTLIEVMLVILILGMMATFVVPSILGNQEEAQLKKTASDINGLVQAMTMYKLKNNVFPSTEQGLDALVTEPTIEPLPRNYPADGFIQRLPSDPWGNAYQLLSPGEMGTFDVFSNGPDGEPGTEDDIGNWNLDEYLD